MRKVLQQEKRQMREEKILLRLDEMNFATREQLQSVEDLGGERNAQRILQRMEKSKLINSIRYESKIYYLSNKGKERVGSNQSKLKRDRIKHTLMRNDLYISLGQPKDWKKEYPINFNEDTLIPDAIYTENNVFHFVEIDNVQTMRTNYEKIKRYKELSGMIEKQYRHTPVLVWFCLSETRKEKLKRACEKHRVNYKIY
ncbi:replication-relaxation family protein [Radiobacillus kanasensis]|uniref:replication-relaxation family protein n=1 Tax=Radiobacillus kanasensis TaxID=2844358 RepID=UPI001E547A69|nr:replication-relaxation family protein [Radiobacillus kanasensis]UFT98075.1 replication-relaxation family protein [Radiobacillus kanasensis]